jgi:hypothetical protein
VASPFPLAFSKGNRALAVRLGAPEETGQALAAPARSSSAGLLTGGVRSRARTREPAVQLHAALGAAHERALVEDELAADQALERGAAQHRKKLLFERPVE